MHPRSILAIARKDTIDILLNKNTLFTLLTPLFLAVLFLGISRLVGTHTSKILVYNPTQSTVEQSVTGYFSRPQIERANSPEDVVRAFGPDGSQKRSDYTLGLAVPADFDANLRKGEKPQVQLFLNGDTMNQQDKQILSRLLVNYASAVTNPQPLNLAVTTINPPKSTPVVDLSLMYIIASLLSSFLVGASIVPSLLIEEKEKKTLRMLMVSPASFTDVVLGKLLVGLVYQLVLSFLVIALQQGFMGSIPALILFVLLGSCFGLALGMLAGSIFQTTGALGGFIGILGMVFFIPAIFVGPLGSLVESNPVAQLLKILPTYYIAHGAYDAMQNQNLVNSILFNGGITLACIVVLLIASIWGLRRQAAVAASI